MDKNKQFSFYLQDIELFLSFMVLFLEQQYSSSFVYKKEWA